MRLIFVHGMNQQGRDPDALRADWETALRNAWAAQEIAVPEYELVMPYYGQILDDLAHDRGSLSAEVIARGAGAAVPYTDLEVDLLRQIARRAGATDADIQRELGSEIVDRGPLNWEWVQAIGRWLSYNLPWLGDRALHFVQQVDAYLDRPHIQNAVDAIVRPALKGGPAVVVAHSLGTIVTYRLLRALDAAADVKLYVTLGSPLGIDAVKERIKPPALQVPNGVAHWLNGADERDFVALYSVLDAATFASGIENLPDIHNSHVDPHAILDYLSDKRTSRRIADALRG
jgi:hypothetical protein